MPSVKCFLRVDGEKIYRVDVQDAQETVEGVHCSYEQLMTAIRKDEDLRHVIGGNFEIFDDDYGDYVILTKSIPITNKAKLRVTTSKEIAPSNDITPQQTPTPKLKKEDPHCDKNAAHETAKNTEAKKDEHPVKSDPPADSWEDDDSEYISDEENAENKARAQRGDVTSNVDRSSDSSNLLLSENPKSIEKILAKKSPAFAREYKQFMNRDPWMKQLEDKLLTFLHVEYDRLILMHVSQKKSSDQLWNYISSNVEHSNEGRYKKSSALCRHLFIDESLEYYLEVQLNSQSYRESYALYPNGFALLCNYLARRTLLLALGIDRRKCALIIAATEGYDRATVKQLREEYKKWKETGSDKGLTMLNKYASNLEGMKKRKDARKFRGSQSDISQSWDSDTESIGKKATVLTTQHPKDTRQPKGVPDRVWSIVRKRKSPELQRLMEEIWSRTKDTWLLEETLFTFLIDSMEKGTEKYRWARDRTVYPKVFWEKVAQVMRTSLEKPSISMDDCWQTFNKSLDYYIHLRLVLMNEDECQTCYPCVPHAMNQLIIRPSMGLDRKRVGIIFAIAKRINPQFIREWIDEYNDTRRELGIEGYLMNDSISHDYDSAPSSSSGSSSLFSSEGRWSGGTSSSSLGSTGSNLEALLAGKRERFCQKMIKYRSLPMAEFVKQMALLQIMNDKRDDIGSIETGRNSTSRKQIWTKITTLLRSNFPNASQFKSEDECKKLFRMLMIEALEVRVNYTNDDDRFKVWPCYKLTTRLAHQHFLKNLGITPEFYVVMKAASNYEGAHMDKDLKTSLLNGSKMRELMQNFYIEKLDGDNFKNEERESAESQKANKKDDYSTAFLSHMSALKAESAAERFASEWLVALLVNKKDKCLSLVKANREAENLEAGSYAQAATAGDAGRAWDKIAATMNKVIFPQKSAEYYKSEKMVKLLETYEAIASNVHTRDEAIEFWPKCFARIHDHLIDEAFLSRVCQIDENRVKLLVDLRKSFNSKAQNQFS